MCGWLSAPDREVNGRARLWPTTALAGLLVILLALLTGCSDSFCENQCDCTGSCSDEELSACESQEAKEESTAQAAGCSAPYEELQCCLEDSYECKDGVYVSSGCSREYTNYLSCLDKP